MQLRLQAHESQPGGLHSYPDAKLRLPPSQLIKFQLIKHANGPTVCLQAEK